MNAIDIHNLDFGYEKSSKILQISHLQIPYGQKVFLQGPSGSGKTTLLGLLTGILSPQSGRLKVLDQDLTALSPSARDQFRADRMGYIFQQFNLIPYLNVLENILLPVWMSRARKKNLGALDAENEASLLALRLGLGDLLQRNVLELSVGQQQRVAVARALLGKPDLVIADEPTSALDEDRQEEFVELLLERVKESGATLIFVSHNQQLAEFFDRQLSLSDLQRGSAS